MFFMGCNKGIPGSNRLKQRSVKEFVYTRCKICMRRGGSRITATFKMEHFVILVNGSKPLTVITKGSILNVAAVLDPPLHAYSNEGMVVKFIISVGQETKKESLESPPRLRLIYFKLIRI